MKTEKLPRTGQKISNKYMKLPSSRSPSRELISDDYGQNPILENIVYNSPRDPNSDMLTLPESVIHTALSPQEVRLKLLRGYPPQNCWRLAEMLLKRMGRSYEEKASAQKEFAERGTKGEQYKVPIVEGEPGTGKTSTIIFIHELIYGETPIVFHAGNKPLEHMLFYPSIGSSEEGLPKRIEEAFERGKLSDNTLELLKKEAPDALVTDPQTNKLKLDLSTHKFFPLTEEKNIRLLEKISKIEGLLQGNGTIGVEMKEGPLLQALREGRTLVVDEADKALFGSDGGLSLVMQALSGQIKETYYQHPKTGEAIRISREDCHPEFDMMWTANDLSNDPTQQNSPFVKSFKDRLEPITVPPNGVEELKTRAMQRLLGLNPLLLQLSLADGPTQAYAAEQIFVAGGSSLSSRSKNLLKKGKKFYQGAEQLACAIHALDKHLEKIEATDDILAKKTNIYNARLTIRWLQTKITEALDYTHLIPDDASKNKVFDDITDLSEAAAWAKLADADSLNLSTTVNKLETGFGENLKIILTDWLEQFPVQGHNRDAMRKILNMCRILSGKSEENNLNHGGIQPIEVLWDDLEEEISIDKTTYELQKSYVKILQKRFPELQTIEAEKIIPIQSLQKALDKAKELSSKDGPITYIVGLSQNYMREKDGSPLALIPILDLNHDRKTLREAVEENFVIVDGKKKLDPAVMCGIDELEASLQNPTIRKNYIQTLWKPCSEKDDSEIVDGEEMRMNFQAMMVANPEIQAARILCSKPDPKKPDTFVKTPISVIQSQKEGFFLAYSPDFEETKTTEKTCITNDPKLAAEALLKGFPGPGGRITATACSYWMQSETNPNLTSSERSRIESYIEENRTEEKAVLEIAKLLKASCEIDINKNALPSKIMIRKENKDLEDAQLLS